MYTEFKVLFYGKTCARFVDNNFYEKCMILNDIWMLSTKGIFLFEIYWMSA